MQVGPPAPPSPPPLAPAVTPRLLASSPRAHRPVLSRAPPPSSPQNGVELTPLWRRCSSASTRTTSSSESSWCARTPPPARRSPPANLRPRKPPRVCVCLGACLCGVRLTDSRCLLPADARRAARRRSGGRRRLPRAAALVRLVQRPVLLLMKLRTQRCAAPRPRPRRPSRPCPRRTRTRAPPSRRARGRAARADARPARRAQIFAVTCW